MGYHVLQGLKVHRYTYMCILIAIHETRPHIYIYIYTKIFLKKDITLMQNRVIIFCTQKKNSATYIGCIFGIFIYNLNS